MIALDQLTDLIAKGEQLDVEFKSDRCTKRQTDHTGRRSRTV